MNSLQELNNYNNSLTYSYTDLRIAGLVFDRTTPTNQSLTVNEGASFSHPIGMDVLEVINHETSLPTLTINISSLAGLTINWPVTPAGVTITEMSSGVWQVSGWTNKVTWDQIKSPTITCPQSIPNAYFGTFTYTATIAYIDGALGPQTKSYTTTVSVLDVTFMTNPTTLTYAPSATTAITGNPTIINIDATYPGATFTVVGTPIPTTSVDTFTNSASGGTFTFNNATKTFTISGTRAQVNTRLAALSIVSTANESDFILNYLLSNNQDGTTDQKNQQFRNTSIEYLSNADTTGVSYIEDNASYATITGNPLITDASVDGSGTYTVEVYPAVLSTITDMFSSGTGGSQTFDAVTKKLTITGTRTQANSHLSAIQFRPGEDTVSLFQLTYKLTLPSPRTPVTYKTQNFVCVQSHDEVSNIGLARSYVSNNANLIFSTNTPQITDLDSIGTNTYTVTLNCSFGQWAYATSTSPLTLSPLSNPLTLSGTKAQINSWLSSVRFYPNANVSSSGVFTYVQTKNSNTQVSTSVALNGSVGSYTGGATYTFTATRTWTPSYEDVMYGQITNLLVIGGGGGGGGGVGSYSINMGGGGGGGGSLTAAAGPLYFSANTTYSITIGNGGVGAISGTFNGSEITGNVVGGTGGTSSAFGYNAVGGGPGQSSWETSTPAGGTSGGGYLGGTGLQSGSNRNGGGGGGGPQSRGNAKNASATSAGDGDWGYDVFGYTYYFASGGGGGGVQDPSGNQSFGGSALAGNGATQNVNATSRSLNWNGQTPANPYTTEPTDGSQYYGGGGGGGGGFNSRNGAQGNVGLVRFTVSAR